MKDTPMYIPTYDDMLAAHERIKPHIRKNQRNRQGMGYECLTAAAALAIVGIRTEQISLIDGFYFFGI